MSYRTRSARRVARKSQRNFFYTLIIIGLLLYATIFWILPNLIGGIGFIKNIFKPAEETHSQISENASLAPPILNIPYEATATAQINIKGYGTPHSKVALYIDGAKIDTTEVSADGVFEITNVPLSLGTNNIYGKSIDPDKIGVDENEKESLPSKTIKVIYDNEKPILEISDPEDGKTIQGDKKVKVSGKTELQAQILINGSQVVIDKEGKFESIQPLNDGDNIFDIKAQDAAGNYTEISRRVIYQP